ncbi:MAG TPA: glycerol-3-phosphate dehydrogenase C-terminal domain-containing protein, partial [Acidisoma sp.]|nr:glycerol-3-phosphate dehydrogenase C-terminal domain-containing protein [Acidisoma sp.]
PASVTRDYALELDRHPAPLLTIFGGKITTYRKLAESAVDILGRELGSDASGWTAHALLPGGDLPRGTYARFLRALERAHPWLPAGMRYRYAHAYGTRVAHILGGARSLADLGEELLPDLYEREADYLCRVELAQTAEDILWRRTRLGLRVGGRECARLEEWLARRGNPDPDLRRRSLQRGERYAGS